MDAQVYTKAVHVLTISMAEDEWRAAMVEPDAFFAQVRAKLSEIHAQKSKPKKAAKPKPEGKRKHKIGQTKCEYCGEMISNVGIGRHRTKCAQANAGKLLERFASDAGLDSMQAIQQ